MSAPVASNVPNTDPSSAIDDRKFFGHPRGLGLLFTTEMWERFSYYGMRAILVLFLTQALAAGARGRRRRSTATTRRSST